MILRLECVFMCMHPDNVIIKCVKTMGKKTKNGKNNKQPKGRERLQRDADKVKIFSSDCEKKLIYLGGVMYVELHALFYKATDGLENTSRSIYKEQYFHRPLI